MEERTATFQRRDVQFRDRWTTFGAHTGILELSDRLSPAELRRYELFAEYDDAFLEKLSPDVSVARWKPGAVIFEEGAYIDLAFFVAAGQVEVFLAALNATGGDRGPLFDAQRTMLAAPGAPAADAEAGGTVLASAPATPLAHTASGASGITFLSVMDFDLPSRGRVLLDSGELFGDIGAMSGWPQAATVRTATECTLIQIRVPALRLMKRKSTVLKERIDRLYRQRSLAQQLHATPLLRRCPKVFLEALKEVVELVSCEPDEVIAREGDEVDSLYLVRAGFVKQSKRLESGDVVVNYLSKGMSLGEVELLLGDTGGWTTTSRSVEYSELVRIRREHFVELLRQSPETERLLWSTAQERIRENGYSHRNLDHAEFLETALDDGLVQGNALLVIDLDSCTRCDDCVRACAETHGGRPRFVREGDRYGRLQVASACYHCRDPLCLVGCPTGAIRRAGIGEVVAVSEDICIGCGTCSRACPYDAIMMHDTGEIWPDNMVPEGLRGKPRLVASKCDLCHTRPQGPACVHNCPNGCAFRIGSLEEFKRLLRRR